MKQSRQYDAFISYAHGEDTQIAEAVQNGLQRLARRWEDLNSLRIFRDKTSLQVGPLEPSLREALGNSTFLVVIASPRSAASGWVIEEIRLFLENRPPENILIVLAEGTLAWSAADGYFVMNGKTPFPNLGQKVFGSQQLFLDLRGARRKDLSIGNLQFLDAMATLASTILDTPKEQIESQVVREQRRLRRNQQINLGFRGAIGFGLAPLLMILFVAGFGFSQRSLFSAVGSIALWVGGFAMTGLIGALVCGAGLRCAIGFALGFLILQPLYGVGSLRPFQGNTGDTIALAALTGVGFVLAGMAGAAFAKGIPVRAGGRAFTVGGLAAVALFLLFPDWRPPGVHTYLAVGLWLPERLEIVFEKALREYGELYDKGLSAQLLPLLFGSTVGGLFFGVSLANARISGPKAAGRWRMSASARRALWVGGAVLAVGALAAFAMTQTDGYQIRAASNLLTAGTFRQAFMYGERKAEEWPKAFILAARAQRAFEKRGDGVRAAELSALLGQWIETGSEDVIGSIAREKNEGATATGEIARRAHEAVLRSDNLSMEVRVGLAEVALERKAQALELFRKAESQLNNPGWCKRAEIGRGLYMAGAADEGRKLLQSVADEIIAGTKDHLAIRVQADDLLPSPGDDPQTAVMLEKGAEFECTLGAASIFAVECLCAAGKLEPALEVIHRATSGETDFWHVRARLARAAARAGHYDTAFGILDDMRNTKSMGWGDYDNEGEGLIEIISAANDAKRPDVLPAAVQKIRALEGRVRMSTVSDVSLNRFIGVRICHAYAVAGDFQDAWKVAGDLTEAHANAYADIGAELAKRGTSSEARRALRWAWRDLHLHWTTDESHAYELNTIGEALAAAGDLEAARLVAEDIAPDLQYYGGRRELLAELGVMVAALEAGKR